VSVAVPPHSEAWRGRSGGETCNPLIRHASSGQMAERMVMRLSAFVATYLGKFLYKTIR